MTDTVEIPQDEFSLRPLIVFGGIVLVLGTLFSFLQVLGASPLLVILGIPALAVWLIVVAVRLVTSAWRRRWRTTVAQGVILVSVLPLMVFALTIGPYIHFGLSLPYYLMEVKLSSDGGTKQATFGWGGSGFVGSAQTDRWLVYDPTDKTAARTRTHERDEEAPSAWYETEHLIGNFYLVERHQS